MQRRAWRISAVICGLLIGLALAYAQKDPLAGGAFPTVPRATNIDNAKPINLPANGLPAPYATRSASNPPQIISRPPNAALTVPPGFSVREWATGLSAPRHMIQGANGEVIVSLTFSGSVAIVSPSGAKTLISDLRGPYGLALHENYLYIAETDSVKRYLYDAGAQTLAAGEEVISLAGYAGGHFTRTLLLDAKHEKLYFSVGSDSNVSAGEPPLRATISRSNVDGSNLEIFAAGIRNAVGLAWNPLTGDLWASAHERDGLGDDLVPDFLTRVHAGGFYGWPYAYIGAHEDPRRAGEAPDLVAQTLYPDVLLGSHTGAMDILFYSGKQFPPQYHNGCFVALHGSWNRAKRQGYKVVFVPFANGTPASAPEDFLSGWMLAENRREVWGRPVGLLQLADGSLLVSDDAAGKIWQIGYTDKTN